MTLEYLYSSFKALETVEDKVKFLEDIAETLRLAEFDRRVPGKKRVVCVFHSGRLKHYAVR